MEVRNLQFRETTLTFSNIQSYLPYSNNTFFTRYLLAFIGQTNVLNPNSDARPPITDSQVFSKYT